MRYHVMRAEVAENIMWTELSYGFGRTSERRFEVSLDYVTLRYVSDWTLDFFYHFFQDARVPHCLDLEAFYFPLLDFIEWNVVPF